MKHILFLFVAFIAISSVASGLVMVAEPNGSLLGLTASLLDGTPFKDYFIPGIVLTVLVGFTNLLALYYLFRNHRKRFMFSIAGGFMISGWIIVQMILINAVHWLHFIYLAAGMLVILISFQLKGKWAV